MFFIHAVNIHNGGGQTLLNGLLLSIPNDLKVTVLADRRYYPPEGASSNLRFRFISGTIIGRFLAEVWLKKNVQSADCVLCFGNLPPLFKLAGYTSVFIQNRYLIDWVSLKSLSSKLKIRIVFERLWLLLRGSSVDQYIVQTPSMHTLLNRLVQKWSKPIALIPFSNLSKEYRRSSKSSTVNGEVDFIYVASGEAHKNHRTLIGAWRLLAQEGFRPSLWLTVSEKANHELCTFLAAEIEANDLCINNLGTQSHEKILSLYKRSKALIYPSNFESFGLPLIEARQAGIPIVASELDYVRDIVDPEEVFDPESAVSIARAVKRFMGWPEGSLPLVDGTHFWQSIMKNHS